MPRGSRHLNVIVVSLLSPTSGRVRPEQIALWQCATPFPPPKKGKGHQPRLAICVVPLIKKHSYFPHASKCMSSVTIVALLRVTLDPCNAHKVADGNAEFDHNKELD